MINNTQEEIFDFALNDEGLKVNEYNLYWKKQLIPGDYRNWRKRCTNAIWKNEILNSKKLEDLFYYNFSNEFDWNKSLKFISNRNKYSFRQCGKDDSTIDHIKSKIYLKTCLHIKFYSRG